MILLPLLPPKKYIISSAFFYNFRLALTREKPLEFLAERWMAEQNVDLSGEFDHIFYSMGYQEESSEPEAGPTMC